MKSESYKYQDHYFKSLKGYGHVTRRMNHRLGRLSRWKKKKAVGINSWNTSYLSSTFSISVSYRGSLSLVSLHSSTKLGLLRIFSASSSRERSVFCFSSRCIPYLTCFPQLRIILTVEKMLTVKGRQLTTLKTKGFGYEVGCIYLDFQLNISCQFG